MDNGLASGGTAASVAAMASPQDLPRQVNQNTNDITELYKLQAKTYRRVKRIEREHGLQLDLIECKLEVQAGKLDEILGILKAS